MRWCDYLDDICFQPRCLGEACEMRSAMGNDDSTQIPAKDEAFYRILADRIKALGARIEQRFDGIDRQLADLKEEIDKESERYDRVEERVRALELSKATMTAKLAVAGVVGSAVIAGLVSYFMKGF